MKRRWLIGMALLGLSACMPQQNADIAGAILGSSLGGPIGGLAGVMAVQPLPQGWEWQQAPQPDYSAAFAQVNAQNQQLIEQQNWQTLNAAVMQQNHVGLIPEE